MFASDIFLPVFRLIPLESCERLRSPLFNNATARQNYAGWATIVAMKSAAETAWIVERAKEHGFDLCGVAPASKFPELAESEAWFAKGYAGEMNYLADPRRGDPERVLAGARSVIVCAMNYNVRCRSRESSRCRCVRLPMTMAPLGRAGGFRATPGARLSRRIAGPAECADGGYARSIRRTVRGAGVRRYRADSGTHFCHARGDRLDRKKHAGAEPAARVVVFSGSCSDDAGIYANSFRG